MRIHTVKMSEPTTFFKAIDGGLHSEVVTLLVPPVMTLALRNYPCLEHIIIPMDSPTISLTVEMCPRVIDIKDPSGRLTQLTIIQGDILTSIQCPSLIYVRMKDCPMLSYMMPMERLKSLRIDNVGLSDITIERCTLAVIRCSRLMSLTVTDSVSVSVSHCDNLDHIGLGDGVQSLVVDACENLQRISGSPTSFLEVTLCHSLECISMDIVVSCRVVSCNAVKTVLGTAHSVVLMHLPALHDVIVENVHKVFIQDSGVVNIDASWLYEIYVSDCHSLTIIPTRTASRLTAKMCSSLCSVETAEDAFIVLENCRMMIDICHDHHAMQLLSVTRCPWLFSPPSHIADLVRLQKWFRSKSAQRRLIKYVRMIRGGLPADVAREIIKY